MAAGSCYTLLGGLRFLFSVYHSGIVGIVSVSWLNGNLTISLFDHSREWWSTVQRFNDKPELSPLSFGGAVPLVCECDSGKGEGMLRANRVNRPWVQGL